MFLSIYLSDTIRYLNVNDKIKTIDNIKIIKITDNEIYYIKSLGFLGEQTKKIKKDRIIFYQASDFNDFKSNTFSIDTVRNNNNGTKGFYDLSIGLKYIPRMLFYDFSVKILGLNASLKFGLAKKKKENNFIKTTYLYASIFNDILNKEINIMKPQETLGSLGFGSSSYFLNKKKLHYVKVHWGLRYGGIGYQDPIQFFPILPFSWNIGYGIILNRKVKIELSAILHNYSGFRKYNYINLNCALSLNTLHEYLLIYDFRNIQR